MEFDAVLHVVDFHEVDALDLEVGVDQLKVSEAEELHCEDAPGLLDLGDEREVVFLDLDLPGDKVL